MSDYENIITFLDELKEDSSCPKNVRTRIAEIAEILNGSSEQSIKVDKAIHILEELQEDANIDSFTRTQLYNIIPMLESL
jgi:uncharacterized protein (UPF0147 family)